MTIPRQGDAPVSGQIYERRPGAYAVLRRKHEVLLTLQQTSVPEIQLPGGGIDPGEHTLPALHREVMEETGYRICPIRHLGTYRRFTYMPEYELWAEKVCQIFLAYPVRPHGPPLEADHTATWMPAADAMEALTNQFDRTYIERAFNFG